MAGGGAFAVAQQIGKSLFLPIAVLPFAGVLLGIGASFSNPTTISAYGLEGILHEGGALFSFMLILSNVGGAIFGNLALIFALAVALGMAKKEKGIAVLGAAIFYLVLLTTIHVFLTLDGSLLADGSISPTVKAGAIADVLGIRTLQMGVFAGIITGLMAAWICDKFYKQQLPQAFAFFGGTRFVPIMCMCFGILTGVVMYFVWPIIQNGIFALGALVQAAGYVGTFLFGCFERALIPFGLHHIFYLPFWQTAMGGTMMINGVQVMGAQNIFFAQLADPNTTHFSVDAARFLMGKFPFMMAGLPAAAFAMYPCARPEKKQAAGSLLFSVGLTSFLTGITEPIEFITFLFLAKELFGIHVIYAGISFMLCHMLGIAMGTTFSDGLIDFILYGVLPGQAKTNWMMMLPLFGVYAVLYFFTFRFFILKWDLKTPGREDDDAEVKMMSKADYQKATGVGVAGGGSANVPADFDTKSATILAGVGGVDNVTEIDCCATRLRLTLNDGSKVDEAKLKSTGAGGVVIKGNAIQVIYGPSVTIVKANFEEFVEGIREGKIDRALAEQAGGGGSAAPAAAAEPEKPKMKDAILGAHQTGRMMLMNEVPDAAFASRAMGDGVAVEPSEGKLFAPADGTINLVFDTKHAVGMVTDDGTELLMHIGIDTVKLGGKHFEAHVQPDQKVKKGDLLVTFDIDAIHKEGYPVTTPLIVVNTPSYSTIRPLKTGDVKAGDDLLEVLG